MSSSAADDHWDDGPGVIDVARRYWVALVVAALVFGGLGYGLSLRKPVEYRATANLILADPRQQNMFGEEDPLRRVKNQMERIQSRDVAQRAASELGGDVTANEVLGSIDVDAALDNDVISVTATAPTAERAAETANAVANAYQDAVAEQVKANADKALAELEASGTSLRTRIQNLEARLREDPSDTATQAQRDALVGQLATLTGRADQIAVDASLYGSGVQLFEPAQPPLRPVGRGAKRNAAGGAVVGVALATAAGWVLARRRRSADLRSDPGDVLGVPLLGSVPEFSLLGVQGLLPTKTDPRSPAAEAYHFLFAPLSAQLRAIGGHTVLVTSPQPGDGKTVTALNLAIAASRDERDILLVDADARVQGLSRATRSAGGPGLHELQMDPDSLVWSSSRRDMDGVPGVEIVPAGSTIEDPAGFFRTTGFHKAMRRIRDHAEFVIIDSPPLLAVSDTWAIAEHVDGIVLVVSQGTPLEVLEEVRDRAALLRTPLLGYVFNRADVKAAPYAYYYDRYQSAAPPAPPPKRPDATVTKGSWVRPPPKAPRRDGVAAMQEMKRP